MNSNCGRRAAGQRDRMKIKTQFIITLVLFGVVLVGMAISAVVTNRLADEATAQDHVIDKLTVGGDNLAYLAYNYVLFNDPQIARDWRTSYNTLLDSVAQLHVSVPVQRELVDSIKQRTMTFQAVFADIADTVTANQIEGIPLNWTFIEDAWTRLATESQSLVQEAERLNELLHLQVTELRQASAIVTLILFGMFGVYIAAIYYTAYRRMFRSLGQLQEGMELIGAGNLDYRTPERQNDEIGDVARAVNRMTANLKQVTASRDDLEQEIRRREQVQDELRLSEEKFRIVSEFTHDMEHWRAPDGTFIYFSPSSLRITGYSAEELIGQPELYAEMVHPDDRQPVIDHLNEGINLQLCEMEYRIIRKDGTARWISHVCQAVVDAEGNYLGRRASDRDTTGHHEIQEDLRRSEEKFRNLFSTMSEAFALHEMIFDAEGSAADYRFIDVNDAFERITGLSRDAVIGKTVHEALPGIEDYWIEMYGHVALSGAPINFEGYSAPLGRWFGVYAYAPGPGQVAVLFSDITERKEAEKLLAEKDERLVRAQELASLGSWDLDIVNDHLSWSDETYRIFGLEPQEFEATYEAFMEAIHPDDREAVDTAYLGSIERNEDSYETEHRIIRKHTGEVRYVHEKCEHQRDANGKIVRSVGMVHDITTRKKAEEAISLANAELEQANQELEAFNYTVSHDLRAPLRSISGFSQALREDYSDRLDGQGTQYLDYVLQATALMDRLIDDLLELARVNRTDLRRESLDLTEMASDIIEKLRQADPETDRTVVIQPGLTTRGDRNLLRLALQNLLDNAWKFTGKTADPRIEFGVLPQSGRVFFVRDNGVGFDMTYRDRLFQAFQRLHKASDFGGTGIGLATVQRVVRRHGGTIWAESKPDQGSTFYFTLG